MSQPESDGSISPDARDSPVPTAAAVQGGIWGRFSRPLEEGPNAGGPSDTGRDPHLTSTDT